MKPIRWNDTSEVITEKSPLPELFLNLKEAVGSFQLLKSSFEYEQICVRAHVANVYIGIFLIITNIIDAFSRREINWTKIKLI